MNEKKDYAEIARNLMASAAEYRTLVNKTLFMLKDNNLNDQSREYLAGNCKKFENLAVAFESKAMKYYSML